MGVRSRTKSPKLLATAMVLGTALALPAQTPPPAPAPTPPVEEDAGDDAEQGSEPEPAPQPPDPPPAPPVIDPTKAAAELLRKRLGLDRGPGGETPKGPPDPIAPPPDAGAAPPTATPPQEPTTPPQEPAPRPQEQGQEPKPPADPTEAAKRALQRLLPGARPPEVAPIPNAAGTPEPMLPRDPDAAPPTRPQRPEEVAVPWSGTLSSRYRARNGADGRDQDLVTRLSLDVGRSERDAVSFHLAARAFVNLDGRDGENPFAGLDHSFGDDVNVRLYQAHVDLHRVPHTELVRVGRQDLDETPTVVAFDGLRVDSRPSGPARAWLSLYGGVPVHQFEASARGDSVYGAAVGCQPWTGARVRLDWMELRDDFLAIDRRDGLLGARWWQTLGDLQLHGLHTWVDGDPRDLQLGARGEFVASLRGSVLYRELLTSQRTQVNELDPFSALLLEYEPYRQLDASLGTDLGDHVAIDVGADVRRLSDRSDERAFNREFERWHVDVALLDLGVRGLSLSVAGSVWQSSGEAFRALSGELEYRPDRDLRVALGSAYDLFRYDAFDDREREHVRTWYARGTWRAATSLRVDGGYEYERNDLDEFHLFRLGMTWTL